MSPLFAGLMMALSPAAAPPAPDCEALDRHGIDDGVRIPGHLAIHRVIGEGRLQFYSAPDERCRMPGVFIIPKDEVIAYSEFGSYTRVMYLKKAGGDAIGWVRSERLHGTGTGISPE